MQNFKNWIKTLFKKKKIAPEVTDRVDEEFAASLQNREASESVGETTLVVPPPLTFPQNK